MQSISPEQIMMIVWICVMIAVVTLLTWLTVRLKEGKSSEEGKRAFKAFLTAMIGTFAAAAIYYVFGLFGEVRPFVIGVAPYIVYIVWLGLVKWIFDTTWETSILVSLVALFFIVVFISILTFFSVNVWIFNTLVA